MIHIFQVQITSQYSGQIDLVGGMKQLSGQMGRKTAPGRRKNPCFSLITIKCYNFYPHLPPIFPIFLSFHHYPLYFCSRCACMRPKFTHKKWENGVSKSGGGKRNNILRQNTDQWYKLVQVYFAIPGKIYSYIYRKQNL